ncbi:hypothetical protein NMG60_11017274 [Bertholletia excelsa]
MEELKIREELQIEVERDLEAEIKDEIYHLAFRLHRLYQHQNKRINATKQLSDSGQEGKTQRKSRLSEVNISIRMEGETKIEIREIKKDGRPRTSSTRSEHMPGKTGSSGKKFNWAGSLRSEGRPIVIKKKTEGPHQAKVINYEHSVYHNPRFDHGRRKWNAAQKTAENKLLELGWRS